MLRRPVCLSALILLVINTPAIWASVKSEMDALTGSVHTRVVWQQGGHYYDGGGKVMGYDSRTDQIHTILPEQSYRKPILCTGGHKLIVTSDDWKVYLVDFDDGTKEFLTNGFCSDVWVHPQTGKEWLFIRNNNAVERHLLEDPSQTVHLYSGSAGHPAVDWWSVSADGTAGADFLPWDNGFYIANAAAVGGQTPAPTNVTSGCWASMSCENSYYWFHLDGDHHYMKVFYKDEYKHRLYVNAPAPSNHNAQIYHPRFASKGGHYMTCSAGYDDNGSSNYAEICLGKFNSDYSGFSGWVTVTSNSVFENNGDAWVGVESLEPSIVLSPSGLSFETQEGSNPATQSVQVSTPTGSLEGLAVSDNADWLTTSLSGTTINNAVNVSGLAARVHTAEVTVSASNANPSVKKYTVTLTVVGAPVASSIAISPQTASMATGSSQQFSATVNDQYDQPLSQQPTVTWSVSPAGATISAAGFFEGATEGEYTVTAIASGLSETASVTVSEQPPVAIKINCGGPAIDGWESDASYLVAGSEGNPYTFGGTHDVSAVQDPAPAAVYQTVRHTDHRYSFAEVPEGAYLVRIHFTDAHESDRAMVYTIEGKTRLENFNVTDEAGGINKVVIKEFAVAVSDGNGLQIAASSGTGDDVFECGIEILSGGDLPAQITVTAPQPGQSVSVGDKLVVNWSATEDVGVNVRISLDEGPWMLLTTGKSAKTVNGTGTFEWIIAEAILGTPTVSDAVVVKVSDYWDEDAYGESGVFRIEAASAVAMEVLRKMRSFSVRQTGRTNLAVSVNDPGIHTVAIYATDGSLLVNRKGTGPRTYSTLQVPAAGIYVLKLTSGGRDRLRVITVR